MPIGFDHDGNARIARVTDKGVKLGEAIREADDVGKRTRRDRLRGRGLQPVHVDKRPMI